MNVMPSAILRARVLALTWTKRKKKKRKKRKRKWLQLDGLDASSRQKKKYDILCIYFFRQKVCAFAWFATASSTHIRVRRQGQISILLWVLTKIIIWHWICFYAYICVATRGKVASTCFIFVLLQCVDRKDSDEMMCQRSWGIGHVKKRKAPAL